MIGLVKLCGKVARNLSGSHVVTKEVSVAWFLVRIHKYVSCFLTAVTKYLPRAT